MLKLSMYENFVKFGDFEIEDIFQGIIDCELKAEIEQIRKFYKDGDKETADNLKKKLPAFTASGIFSNPRKKENLQSYSKLVILDFDKVEDLSGIFSEIKKMPNTYAAFISPKGDGIKVLVRCNSEWQNHESAFDQISDYYASVLEIPIDKSGRDISRLCFVSADANLYYNFDSKIFEVKDLSYEETVIKGTMISGNYINNNPFSKLINTCNDIVSMYSTYQVGNRNNHIFKLASKCNRMGIPLEFVLDTLTATFDLNTTEILETTTNAYKKEEFGRDAFFANNHFVKNYALDTTTSPVFPEEIYSLLPNLLKRGTGVFTESRQKDMFLVSSLAVLGGCINDFDGLYDSKLVHPNLFTFIVAPAASGKGVMVYAKELGEAYHKHLIAQTRNDLRVYQQKLDEYNEMIQSAEEDADYIEKPIEPSKRILFIPGNSSSAAFIEKMVASNEKVILFETEADTMSNTFKNDWGSYSEILRAAFHHETVSVNRKGKDALLEMNKPRLSVSISGTPNQVVSLIKSPENGLFSRFIYYTFKEPMEWRDVSPNSTTPDRGAYFSELSQDVLQMVNFFDLNPAKFSLAPQQWDELNHRYKLMVDYYTLIAGGNSDINSVITRSGLIRFRIAMILSAIRKFEQNDKSNEWICLSEDFETAEKIADVLLIHSFIIMNQLPKNEEPSLNNIELTLFNSLTNEFNRLEAISKGELLGIKARSSDGYLNRLVKKGKLRRVANGKYQKV